MLLYSYFTRFTCTSVVHVCLCVHCFQHRESHRFVLSPEGILVLPPYSCVSSLPLSNLWRPLTTVLWLYFFVILKILHEWNPKFVTFWGCFFPSSQLLWIPLIFFYISCKKNSFLLSNIHGMDISVYFTIYPVKSIWVIFGFGLIQKEKPWTVMYGFLC